MQPISCAIRELEGWKRIRHTRIFHAAYLLRWARTGKLEKNSTQPSLQVGSEIRYESLRCARIMLSALSLERIGKLERNLTQPSLQVGSETRHESLRCARVMLFALTFELLSQGSSSHPYVLHL